MRNPEQTKDIILNKSGTLFNTVGYKATSISNITDATGYTKGAIYRHFKSKEELEKESFSYLSSQMLGKLRDLVKQEKNAGNKLRALFKFFQSYAVNPPIKGGCPLLNAAIEADDANPLLQQEALKTLNILKGSIISILENGIKYGQIREDTDKGFYATLIVASLEGAIMMSKLSRDDTDLKQVCKHLEKQVELIEK